MQVGLGQQENIQTRIENLVGKASIITARHDDYLKQNLTNHSTTILMAHGCTVTLDRMYRERDEEKLAQSITKSLERNNATEDLKGFLKFLTTIMRAESLYLLDFRNEAWFNQAQGREKGLGQDYKYSFEDMLCAASHAARQFLERAIEIAKTMKSDLDLELLPKLVQELGLISKDDNEILDNPKTYNDFRRIFLANPR